MYKVFFNDSFLQVTSTPPSDEHVKVIPYRANTVIDEWILASQQHNKPNRWAIVTSHPHETWINLTKQFSMVEAAGGLVRNGAGKYLFIYRRKRWDLPKGKLDASETPEQTAIREVEEETGLTPLKVNKFLTHTYHIYLLKDRFTLKRTHWFLMEYLGNKPPVPQTIEDIERAEWMTLEEFHQVKEPIFGTVEEVIRAATMLKS
jgi:8-oxo-dGTP pyrophosphatase MutT (NUDIX family)